ncbi:MAG TPA: hypothetical protein VFQ35_18780 [Polyangiaceae bacterium]|nr:hypothetical protein [Polyangiaceae bacterium]
MDTRSSPPKIATSEFPPEPTGLKGRRSELRTLSEMVRATHPTRIALVGSGGSGKSMLAAALGHRLKRAFGGRADWFRVGAWDFRTVTEMFALRFGMPRDERRERRLQRFFSQSAPRLIVLDNHENDRAMARLLETFANGNVSFIITARRCLLAGVLIFPVTAPLVTAGESAFPRVAGLTRLLRWNPLALDIADAIVRSRGTSATELAEFLRERGVARVRAQVHEDDLPEVALLLDWAWRRLSREARRMLGVLAHLEGDHIDVESLRTLARLRSSPNPGIEELRRWHLIQEPARSRYTLHAVVRHALAQRTKPAPERTFEHYVSMLERQPDRFAAEQTHLFAAMDYAYRESDMKAILRVDALMRRLDGDTT